MTATAWKPIGPDTPRDRDLLVRFSIHGPVHVARWSDLASSWNVGGQIATPKYWAEIPE